MNSGSQQYLAQAGAVMAAIVIVLCVTLLTVDYLVARVRTPKDDQLILELQEQVREDSSRAPVLAAVHARVTSARAARKARVNQLSILLIGASALFLTCAKWLISRGERQAVAMEKLVRIVPAPALPASAPRTAAKPAAPEEIDLAFVDHVIEKEGRGAEAAIPILQAIQNHYRYLPDEALQRVCERTEITPAQIAGTSSFYAQFRRSPVGRHIVRVCHGTACHVSGARQITDELRRHLRIPEGEDTDLERLFTLDEVACLGCCSLAPVLMVDGHTAGTLTPSSACACLDTVREEETA